MTALMKRAHFRNHVSVLASLIILGAAALTWKVGLLSPGAAEPGADAAEPPVTDARGSIGPWIPVQRPLPPGVAPAPGDRPVYARIDSLRRLWPRLVVDGKDMEWEGFPCSSIQSQRSDPASLSVVKTAVAPFADGLYVALWTKGRPSQEPNAFGLYVSFAAAPALWIGIQLSQSGNLMLRCYDRHSGHAGPVLACRGAIVKVDDIVEARIPYGPLLDGAPSLRADGVGPWVRVVPAPWDSHTSEWCDVGPAAASYFLLPTPYALDQPLPDHPAPTQAVPLPVKGQWYISAGAFGPTHRDESAWAYDLTTVDERFFDTQDWLKPVLGNEDYYCWDRPVYSPMKCTVLDQCDGESDRRPEGGHEVSSGNFVLMSCGSGLGLRAVHLRKGSVTVGARQVVEGATEIGRVGSSGLATGPHLHLQLERLSGSGTVPLAFANVRVSLNPGLADPWARELPTWEPREGVLVNELTVAPAARSEYPTGKGG